MRISDWSSDVCSPVLRPAATMAPRPAVPSDAASSLAAPSLAVRGLSKAFGGVEAVKDVSFQVAEGELLALIGPNGAGKSTCFNMLNGQIQPQRGRGRSE